MRSSPARPFTQPARHFLHISKAHSPQPNHYGDITNEWLTISQQRSMALPLCLFTLLFVHSVTCTLYFLGGYICYSCSHHHVIGWKRSDLAVLRRERWEGKACHSVLSAFFEDQHSLSYTWPCARVLIEGLVCVCLWLFNSLPLSMLPLDG